MCAVVRNVRAINGSTGTTDIPRQNQSVARPETLLRGNCRVLADVVDGLALSLLIRKVVPGRELLELSHAGDGVMRERGGGCSFVMVRHCWPRRESLLRTPQDGFFRHRIAAIAQWAKCDESTLPDEWRGDATGCSLTGRLVQFVPAAVWIVWTCRLPRVRRRRLRRLASS